MEEIFKTIGNTPLIKIDGIWAKLENKNLTGSIKDRMAWYMVKKAIERGELKKGDTIIEATSGNTGISLAAISAILGFKFIAVLPKSVKSIKPKIILSLGAKVVRISEETEEAATKEVEKLAKKFKKVWLPKQFENPDNVECHYKTTGREIVEQIKKVDAFVAGIGTGGTLIGVAKALKEKYPKVKIFGVRPAEITHKIEGLIGKNESLPKIFDKSLVDEIIEIESQQAIKAAKFLIKRGVLVGISSGANFLVAKKLAKKYENVVTVFPDNADRYWNLLLK